MSEQRTIDPVRWALAGMIEAVRNCEIDPGEWDLYVAKALTNAYRALGMNSIQIAQLAEIEVEFLGSGESK